MGTESPTGGEFREIDPPERLRVHDDGVRRSGRRPDARGSQHGHVRRPGREDRADAARGGDEGHPRVAAPLAGMEEGWLQSFEKLDGLLTGREVDSSGARSSRPGCSTPRARRSGRCGRIRAHRRVVGTEGIHHDDPGDGRASRRDLASHDAWAGRHRLCRTRSSSSMFASRSASRTSHGDPGDAGPLLHDGRVRR